MNPFTSRLFDLINLSRFRLSAGDTPNVFCKGGVPLLLSLLEVFSHTIASRSTVIVVVLEPLSLLCSPVVNQTRTCNSSVPLPETEQAQATKNRHAQVTTKSVFIFGTQSGVYIIKVVNLSLGPVQVWSVATPLVAIPLLVSQTANGVTTGRREGTPDIRPRPSPLSNILL